MPDRLPDPIPICRLDVFLLADAPLPYFVHMQSFLAELVFNDGFCQISCGRCPCCVAPAEVLQKLGANRFLQVGRWLCRGARAARTAVALARASSTVLGEASLEGASKAAARPLPTG